MYAAISSQLPKLSKVKVQRIYGAKMKSNIKGSEHKQAVLAMIHGDAHVDVNPRSGKARLDIYHCADQYEYIMWKKEVLEDIQGVTCRVSEKVDTRLLKSGKTRKGYRLQTNFSSYLYNLHVTPLKFQIKQLVKPLALAILWQDDGTLVYDSKVCYSTANLCTDAWDRDSLKQFRDYFNKQYGWTMRNQEYLCRGKTYPRLRMRKGEMELFSRIVEDFVLDCLEYKIISS